MFLHDGRILLGNRGKEEAVVRVLSKDGTEERVYPLGRGRLWALGGEPEAGKVLATFGELPEAGRDGEPDTTGYDVGLLDLAGGSLRDVAKGRTAVPGWQWGGATSAPGTPAGELFMADGALVRIDAKSGQESVVAGRLRSDRPGP